MSCLRCPMVTVAEMRPDLAEFHRFAALLCPEHFREARASEQTRIARTLREVSRIFCPAFCGNEMYLLRPGVCARCRHGVQEVADHRLAPPADFRRVAAGQKSGGSVPSEP